MEWLERLRQLKAESKLSTREISKLSGVSEATLEKIFAGLTANPGINTLRNVVHVLGATLDDLFPVADTKKSPGSEDSEPRDDLEKEFMSLVKQLSPSQKVFLLSLLKTIIEQDSQASGASTPAKPETAQ